MQSGEASWQESVGRSQYQLVLHVRPVWSPRRPISASSGSKTRLAVVSWQQDFCLWHFCILHSSLTVSARGRKSRRVCKVVAQLQQPVCG